MKLALTEISATEILPFAAFLANIVQGSETKKGLQDAGLFRNVSSLTLGYSVFQKRQQ
ncbi:hypothetical protein [Yoonia vestfoldensis]|uniref:hypothetical protein n=1 Tax=Yoonia vestfoldensis TaxID=245188 RepID=UPI0013EF7A65|nr:hypothetical protein [Yoonia vestfoldensis]